jgi:hypothetical protein
MMSEFFKLSENVEVPGRWHLGTIRTTDGKIPRFIAGIPFTGNHELDAEVSHPGRVLDFCLTSFAVPVATNALAREIQAIAGGDVQCVPVNIAGQSGMYVLNAVRLVPCLDETRSEFIKWTERDHRADLAGQYRQVTKLAIDASAVPQGSHFFRIQGWSVALIVSKQIKDAMESVGCFGAEFTPV